LGRWLRTIVTDRKQLTASSIETIDLPKANFLGKILIRIFNVSGTSPTWSTDRIEVIANGSSVVWSTRGDQMSRQNRYHYGNQINKSLDAIGASDGTANAFFGRTDKDTVVIFPAKLFRTLQLKLSITIGGTTPVYQYSVVADEWISGDDPATKLIQKTVFIEEKAAGAVIKDFDLPLGNLYKQFQVFVTTAPTVSVKYIVSVRINGGAEIPYAGDFQMETNEDAETRNMNAEDGGVFAQGSLPNDAFLDFDLDGSLADVKDSAQYNDFKVRIDPGSNDPGITRLVTTELVRLK
jgi:hypothetical protein